VEAWRRAVGELDCYDRRSLERLRPYSRPTFSDPHKLSVGALSQRIDLAGALRWQSLEHVLQVAERELAIDVLKEINHRKW
jgi:hypothetical protein